MAQSPADKLVMIVDDEADVRLLIEFNIKKEGFRTVTAVNGLDALAKVKLSLPDLIVLDLMMPAQSGFEFLREMQAQGHGSVPVLIATARSLDSSTVQVIRQESNVVDFFNKPFDWPRFIGVLHQRLGTQRGSPRAKERAPEWDA